jgi:tight adherence protein B
VTLLLMVFIVTMVLSGITYLVATRKLEERDTAKMRDRLVGKAPAAAVSPQSTPLFLPDSERRKSLMARLLAALNADRGLQELIEQAGLPWAPGQVVIASLAAGLLAFNAVWYLMLPFRDLAFVAGPAAMALPVVFLRWKRKRRIHAFEAQFPDSLQFIARAMRAGHAFSVSLEMLHQEFPDPLGGEFRRAFEEQNLGLPMDVALEKLAKRIPLMDTQFFIAAVVLQKRTGGNLAEILDNLSKLIRERFKLRGEIRTISAQGRMSSMVLTGIPVVVATMLYFVNRPHMLFFVEHEWGRLMAMIALGFVVAGFLIMSKIVKIEV